jgi:glutamyl-tRNA reductase
MDLLVAGLSHHTAPVELRERIAQPPEQVPHALERLVRTQGFAEGLLLSTCGRTELYGCCGRDGPDRRALEFLDSLRPAGAPPLEGHVYVRRGDDALRHLFRVASGLDSMVVGEVEIARQMSDAYTLACQAGTAGPFLNRAVPRALQIGKRIRTETALSKGVSSVAGAAVALAERVFRDLSNCNVLTIGAGETVDTALRALRPRAGGRLVVCNRTAERAAALAKKYGGETAPLADAALRAAEADIVVAATGALEPHLRAADLADAVRRRERPLLLLDLGVPRDIEPAVAKLPGVYLNDVDDLRVIADRALLQRSEAIPQAEAIVAMAVTEFRRRRQQMEAEPAIKALLDGMLRTRSDVLDHEKNLSPEAREAAERATGRLVDKILRRLAPRMKDGTANPRQLLDAFGIEATTPAEPGDDASRDAGDEEKA